ncbi:hypothetical protein, partial [Rhodobaculum claviforme]
MRETRRAWRAAVLVAVLLGLAGCGGGAKRAAAPDPVPERLHHTATGPAEVTLLTVFNSRTDMGDHAALLITGSQRVIYDPAGSFDLDGVPRRHDVLYGVSPAVEQVYFGYHARATHHIMAQTLPLARAEADALIAEAEARAPATAGFCAIRAGSVLRTLPALAGLSSSPFPRTLSASFGAHPGVTTRRIDATDVPEWARTRGPGFVPGGGPQTGPRTGPQTGPQTGAPQMSAAPAPVPAG